ncbi:nucleotide exchange factor SIL1-like, partial [Oppia nitens]|uniref:nucleotide exchange factor SIL1-like n=1 Tax=Oppia nitens TaxID=1686743 RepID=UPI0023D9DDC1
MITILLVKCNDSQNSLTIVDQNNDEESGEQLNDYIDDEETEFVATDEWQPIRRGQVLPAGLHVRLNLQTGLKEAKLINKRDDNNVIDGSNDNNIQVIDKHKKLVVNEKNDKLKVNIIRDQIKQVIENMKFGKNDNFIRDEMKTREKSSEKFRTMDEIKKDFDAMNVNIRSESEILKILINRYTSATIEDKLTLLTDMEFLVHSIDIGRDLIDLKAIPLLLSDLNSTDNQLRAQIAFTLGSAMNSNPKVQLQVLQNGGLKKFLLLLQSDPSFNVKKRVVFAISSLVRHFPRAQKSLVEEYGALTIFANFFKTIDNNSIKLCVKVITLLNDLLIEKKMALKYATNDKLTQLKAQQYYDIELNYAIINNKFCQLVPQLLNLPDTDVREKTIEAMDSLSVVCKNDFKTSLPTLHKISDNLKSLSTTDSFDE